MGKQIEKIVTDASTYLVESEFCFDVEGSWSRTSEFLFNPRSVHAVHILPLQYFLCLQGGVATHPYHCLDVNTHSISFSC